MKMKHVIAIFVTLVTATAAVAAEDTYFPYPQVPESLENLQERSDYLIGHFWERCNLKSAFSSRVKMKKAFADYVNLMPYASRDVVETSVKNLIDEVKKEPRNLLTLGEIAEETLYSDSAEVLIDEIYLYFAEAVAKSGKISSAEKARFAHQAKVLNLSMVGMKAYPLEFTAPDGSKGNLEEVSAPYIILFFNDPDCEECVSVKVNLATDFYTTRLINDGTLKIVSIYPGDADAQWRTEAAEYPETWVVGASPEADSFFDMRSTPTIYLLDSEQTIVEKNIDINRLLAAIRSVGTNR